MFMQNSFSFKTITKKNNLEWIRVYANEGISIVNLRFIDKNK